MDDTRYRRGLVKVYCWTLLVAALTAYVVARLQTARLRRHLTIVLEGALNHAKTRR